jgi:hypothetical protein
MLHTRLHAVQRKSILRMSRVNTARPRAAGGSPLSRGRDLNLPIRRQVPAKPREKSIRRVEERLEDPKPASLKALTADYGGSLQCPSAQSDPIQR